jgi:hypothetical protein
VRAVTLADRVGDQLSVVAHTPRGQVLRDPLVGQSSGSQTVAHCHRARPDVGHGVMLHPHTDSFEGSVRLVTVNAQLTQGGLRRLPGTGVVPY